MAELLAELGLLTTRETVLLLFELALLAFGFLMALTWSHPPTLPDAVALMFRAWHAHFSFGAFLAVYSAIPLILGTTGVLAVVHPVPFLIELRSGACLSTALYLHVVSVRATRRVPASDKAAMQVLGFCKSLRNIALAIAAYWLGTTYLL